VQPPFVLGHEPGGTVVDVGKNVKRLKTGDRVALEPGKTCGHCEFCRRGEYNLCPNVVFFATPPVDGVFQEYVAHEADLCFKLPNNVSTLEGALIEPLAVGFHAANQGGAHVGQTTVVMGAGCIGLVSMMALKAEGVSRVYVVDIMQKRLSKALELGADGVINGRERDAVQAVLDLTDGKGCDLVIETAGAELTTRQSISIARKGATIVLVGYGKSGEMTLPMSRALDKELSFKTVFRYRHIYPAAIDSVASGRVNLKGIVTDVFDFDDIQNAMDKSVADKANIVKAVVKIAGDVTP
jgi:L-iditol 2-dehydrogenase